MTTFIVGFLLGSAVGFLTAAILAAANRADLIDVIELQNEQIRKLARQLQDAQAVQL